MAANVIIEPQYMNLRQLSIRSSIGVRRLREALRDARHPLPHYRIGSKILLISRADFDEWIVVYRRDTSEMKQTVDRIVGKILKDRRKKPPKGGLDG
jgi:hypothetical protein